MDQVGREAKDLGELRTRVEAASAGGWQEVPLVIIHVLICSIFINANKNPVSIIVKMQIGRLTERETKENEGQGERVTECEATVARQGDGY